MTKLPQESWEKKFNKKWINPWNRNHFGIPKAHLDIKEFIQQTLTSDRQRVVEEERRRCCDLVEKAKLPYPNPYGKFVRVERVNNSILEPLKLSIQKENYETK